MRQLDLVLLLTSRAESHADLLPLCRRGSSSRVAPLSSRSPTPASKHRTRVGQGPATGVRAESSATISRRASGAPTTLKASAGQATSTGRCEMRSTPPRRGCPAAPKGGGACGQGTADSRVFFGAGRPPHGHVAEGQRRMERATRKPTSSTWKLGWLRRRAEARQLQCSSNQPPPRSTR